MNAWRKFWRLPREEKAAVLAALLLLPAVRLGLAALGLKRLQRLLGGRLGARPGELPLDQVLVSRLGWNLSPAPEEAARLSDSARRAARLVTVAARYVGGTCLAQAIVLCFLLDRRGAPAHLKIGVRKDGEALEAHAWVEVAGVALPDGAGDGSPYAAFDRDFRLGRSDPPRRAGAPVAADAPAALATRGNPS